MIDDWLLSIIYAAWMAASTMPLGLMLGGSCSPCCGCGGGKPVTDPESEGTWTPSGTWRGVGGVTWTFTANPGDDSGETWFFYGSIATSKRGGDANFTEQQDWGNICNWYSSKTTSPSSRTSLATALDKRATRLPPVTAVVHVYSRINTATFGPATVRNIFFWGANLAAGSEISATSPAHDSTGGAVFNGLAANLAVVNGGATFNDDTNNFGTVNGGATFNHNSDNQSNGGTVNGGATFNDRSFNVGSTGSSPAIVNGGATFNNNSWNLGGRVNDGATFYDSSQNYSGNVFGGATFNDSSINQYGIVNDGATFNDSSSSFSTVNGGATFNDSSSNENFSTVNGGATFNDSSINRFGRVNGGATFNDAACSTSMVGNYGNGIPPDCTAKFVAHPTDLPTCNGTAAKACSVPFPACGCG